MNVTVSRIMLSCQKVGRTGKGKKLIEAAAESEAAAAAAAGI